MPLVDSLVNGYRQSHVDIEDRALHYADGLFETMLFKNKKIALWQQHFARLKAGCQRLNLDAPNESRLLQDIKNLTEPHKNAHLIIKLIISRGVAGRGLTVNVKTPVSCFLLAYEFDPARLNIQSHKRLKMCITKLLMNDLLGGVKHLNRLIYVLAANELSENHAEGVMQNDNNEIIECINHNIFFVVKNVLITAPITNCGVAGIKRQQVIDLAARLNISVDIKTIKTGDLKEMDECFITNAVVGVQSVHAIDDVIFKQNTLTTQLQKNLNSL